MALDSSTINKFDPRVLHEDATGTSTNSFADIAWDNGDNSPIYQDIIASTLYIIATTNNIDYQVLQCGVITYSGTVTAGTDGLAVAMSQISEDITVQVKSTVTDSHGTYVACLRGK